MISIKNLTKEFKIFPDKKATLRYILGFARPNRDYDVIKSLQDINLEVPKGEVHGIIGMNGAGKSTLLKILTGVLNPSQGAIEVDGTVAALLELGTGFHGELTGRENIYLNGTIHGFTKEQIEEKIPEILEFSELGDFFDRPVKIYSSGMYVRLAFSFAVTVEPDVLIIDEALSVGDAYFQQKCIKKIQQFKRQGVTILFVSHDIGAVRVLCDRVSVLSKGKLLFAGSPTQAIDLYNTLLADHRNEELARDRAALAHAIREDQSHESGSRQAEITSVKVCDLSGKNVSAIVSGTEVVIEVKMRVNTSQIENPVCGILIRDRLGYDIFGTNTHHLQQYAGCLEKGSSMTFRFKLRLDLGPGNYTLTVALHSDQTHLENNYHWLDRAKIFQVLPAEDFEFIGVARLKPSCSFQVHV